MTSREEYVRITKEKLGTNSSKIMIKQINKYYDAMQREVSINRYKVGELVKLEKGTLLHGTYKNIDGLAKIVEEGLISSWFIEGRESKYPSSIGVWNIRESMLLLDYINFYSGGTVRYINHSDGKNEVEVIPYDEMDKFIERFKSKGYLAWNMEQTKEARFLPSLVQDQVQIGIIFNGNNEYTKNLLKGDVLEPKYFNDKEVKDFVNNKYYEAFIVERKKKDAFFTNRESAILFGLPTNLIEGILVGREYEKNKDRLNYIKYILPDVYICNLDGKVIVGNK